MLPEKEIRENLFHIASETDFNSLALRVFRFQVEQNAVYARFVKSLKIDPASVTHYEAIPFLPIELFKTLPVVCGTLSGTETIFTSSGTTGQTTSSHYVKYPELYLESFLKGFERVYGDVRDYCILALLPNYLERTGSSLVFMFDELIRRSGHPSGGFYLHNIHDLMVTLQREQEKKQKILLLGVTYALLDLADTGLTLNDQVIVMETGGMKGRRKEMVKEEVHAILKEKFGIAAVHSEYGMTELLSQAYSSANGLFSCPPWMRVLVRDANDPFHYLAPGRSGGINVIDLANVYSCSFIETKDLGKIHGASGFEILGRFDNSDLRGCNLMIG